MTIIDIITHSPNAWLLYGYLLEKSNGGKELVMIPTRKIAEELKMPRQQVRTALNYLVGNQVVTQVVTQVLTQQVTQVSTQVTPLQVSNNLLVTLLGDVVVNPTANPTANPTTNPSSNPKSTQKKATKKFKPPTLNEITKYYIEYATKNNEWKDFSPEQFYMFYKERNWHLSNGDPMKSWKIAMTGTWLPSPKRKVITEQQWRMAFNNEKPQIGVGEFLDNQGNRRYKLSNGYATQVIVPLSAPPRADYEQLWSEAQNKWYYE